MKLTNVKKIALLIFITIMMIGTFYFWNQERQMQDAGEIAIVSISSDGHYAISTDAKNFAILWDIQNKKKLILSRDANLYSAYWVKNTPYFMWQDVKTKVIHVTDVGTQKDVETMHPDFLVYGQAMSSDLKYHVVSDVNWNIYVGQNHEFTILTSHYDDMPGFEGPNKLINFAFLDNNTLLTSGMAAGAAEDPQNITGVFLWDLKTLKPLHDYIGNITQTFATLSPDGKYVVAGDNGSWLFVWETATGKKIVSILTDEPILKYNKDSSITGDKNVLPIPYDFIDGDGIESSFSIMSVKFIDDTHYLRFTTYVPYVMLYEVTNPKPLKYIPLGKHPAPALKYYARDQAIDTSPSAHILVMGKENEGGILVYSYNPTTEILTKVWDGN